MSLSVGLDVPQLLSNGKPQQAEILRDDSPWDKEGFRLKNIRIRWTFSRKIACIVHHRLYRPKDASAKIKYLHCDLDDDFA